MCYFVPEMLRRVWHGLNGPYFNVFVPKSNAAAQSISFFYFPSAYRMPLKLESMKFMCALCSQIGLRAEHTWQLGMCLISRTLNNVYWTHSPSSSSSSSFADPLKFADLRIRFTVVALFASLSSIADDSTIAAGTVVIYIPTRYALKPARL